MCFHKFRLLILDSKNNLLTDHILEKENILNVSLRVCELRELSISERKKVIRNSEHLLIRETEIQ